MQPVESAGHQHGTTEGVQGVPGSGAQQTCAGNQEDAGYKFAGLQGHTIRQAQRFRKTEYMLHIKLDEAVEAGIPLSVLNTWKGWGEVERYVKRICKDGKLLTEPEVALLRSCAEASQASVNGFSEFMQVYARTHGL